MRTCIGGSIRSGPTAVKDKTEMAPSGARRALLASAPVTSLLRLRPGSREQLLGTVVTCRDPVLAELVGARFDLAWIDLEHSALDVGDVPALAVALGAVDCAAFVRVPDSRFERLAAVLDAGVDGVVVPRLESAAEAADVVARLRYPPHGRRGFAARRGAAYGRRDGPPRTDAACLVQIESRAALSAAAAIAAVEGVDGLVVGTADLALDLGVALDLHAPAMADAFAATRAAARGAGVAFGIAAGGDPEAIARTAGGAPDIVVYSADVRLYAQAIDDAATCLVTALASQTRHERD
jgi:2-keto-3-deoxy-L-rhamnonate aldolase RhmA